MVYLLTTFLVALGLFVAFAVIRTIFVINKYTPQIFRIFTESPIFSPPAGDPVEDATELRFTTHDGVTLCGNLVPSQRDQPRGIIVFCSEFMGDRWSGRSYWEHLRDQFAIFVFDFRNHGESESQTGYTSRHWVTQYEIWDAEAAVAQAKKLAAAGNLPVGIYGVSRGGGTAIMIAGNDPSILGTVTDGAFSTHVTTRVYMRKWLALYSNNPILRQLPDCYFDFVRDRVLARVQRELKCSYPKIERSLTRISPRPVLMIQGGRDSYIRPDIGREFYGYAKEPKEFWVIKGARHNSCLDTAGAEYRDKVLTFFQNALSPNEDSP